MDEVCSVPSSFNLNDSTGNANNLILSSNLPAIPGLINGATVGNNSGWLTTTSSLNLSGDFTINYWTIPNPTGVAQQFCGRSGSGINFNVTNQRLYYGIPNVSTKLQYVPLTDGISTTAWCMATLTRQGTTTKLYYNGTLVATGSDATTSYSGTYSLFAVVGGSYIEYSAGTKLDEVGVWGRALSDSEITSLYNSGAGQTYAASPSGAIAYWNLDTIGTSTGDGIRYDSVGNLALTNNCTSIVGGCAVFNGNSYLSAGSTNLGLTGDFSISLWYKPNDLISYQTLFTSSGHIAIHHNPNNGIDVNNTVTGSSISTVGNFPYSGIWYHIAVVCSSGITSLYINGVFATTTTQALSVQNRIYLGCYVEYNIFYLTGSLDEVAVWGRALSTTEVTYLYNSHTGQNYTSSPSGIVAYWSLDDTGFTDSSGNGYTLTSTNVVSNYPVAVGTGKVGGCAVFNGTNYLSSASISNTNLSEVSVSVWVKNNGSKIAPYPDVVNLGQMGNGTRFEVLLNTDNPYVTLLSINNGAYLLGDNTNILDGNWHHIVATGSSAALQAKLYIDGRLINTISISSLDINLNYTSIGDCVYAPYSINRFVGNVDEVGIWNRAITSTEVASLYNSGSGQSYSNSPQSGLIAYWGFDDSNWSSSNFSPNNLLPQGGGVSSTNSIVGNGAIGNSAGWLQTFRRIDFSKDFTINYWVFPTSNTNVQNFAGENAASINLVLFNNYISCSLPGLASLVSQSTSVANTWCMATITRRAGTIMLYLNGANLIGIDGTYNNYSYLNVTNKDLSSIYAVFTLKDNYWNYSATSYRVIMDEIGVWNRALSLTEINQLYSATSAGKISYPFNHGKIPSICIDPHATNCQCNSGYVWDGLQCIPTGNLVAYNVPYTYVYVPPPTST